MRVSFNVTMGIVTSFAVWAASIGRAVLEAEAFAVEFVARQCDLRCLRSIGIASGNATEDMVDFLPWGAWHRGNEAIARNVRTLNGDLTSASRPTGGGSWCWGSTSVVSC